MKSHWIEHKEKRVFIADFSGFGMNTAALEREANEIVAALKQEPPKSVRSISNVKGTTATVENIRIFQRILPHTNEQVRKRCVVGASGIRWYFVEVINEVEYGSTSSMEALVIANDLVREARYLSGGLDIHPTTLALDAIALMASLPNHLLR